MTDSRKNIEAFQHAISMLKFGSVDLAVKKLELLSKEGDGHADGVLGLIYEFGAGDIHPNISKALLFYEESVVRSSSTDSWMAIGRITLSGPEMVRDYSRAFECFSFLAENSNCASAWLALGNINLQGLGRRRNLDTAEACFLNAMAFGNLLGYPGLARVALSRGRIVESLKYRIIGALKAVREPDGSDALKQWAI